MRSIVVRSLVGRVALAAALVLGGGGLARAQSDMVNPGTPPAGRPGAPPAAQPARPGGIPSDIRGGPPVAPQAAPRGGGAPGGYGNPRGGGYAEPRGGYGPRGGERDFRGPRRFERDEYDGPRGPRGYGGPPAYYDGGPGYGGRAYGGGFGRICVTSRGNCPSRPGPIGAGCGCEVPGFGLKRGAIGG